MSEIAKIAANALTSITHESLPLTNEQRLAEVEALVRQHPEIAGLQAYEYFASNAAVVADEFITDPTNASNPQLTYNRLDAETVSTLAEHSEEALRGLLGVESPQAKALFDSIEYRQSELFMLSMATRMNDQSLSDPERAEATEWFKMTNEALYGVPDKKLFTSLVYQRIYPMLTRDFDDPRLQTIQAELRQMIGNEAFDVTQVEELPSMEELADHIAPLIHERLDHVLEHIDDDQWYEKGAPILGAVAQAVTAFGAREKGWSEDPVKGSSVLATAAHRKMIEVGEDRPAMSGRELKGKIAHELAVHMLRSISAEDAGWLGAAYGMDGYLDFEEAFAIACERVYWKPPAGMNNDQYRYMAAGFAYGIDRPEWYEGERGRDFREVYEIIWRATALETAANLPEGTVLSEQQLATVKESEAYTKATLRVYRGTPCDKPGVAYLKDLSYIRGHRLVAQVLPYVQTQRDLDLLFAGKTDPTKPDHLAISNAIAPGSELANAPWDRKV